MITPILILRIADAGRRSGAIALLWGADAFLHPLLLLHRHHQISVSALRMFKRVACRLNRASVWVSIAQPRFHHSNKKGKARSASQLSNMKRWPSELR